MEAHASIIDALSCSNMRAPCWLTRQENDCEEPFSSVDDLPERALLGSLPFNTTSQQFFVSKSRFAFDSSKVARSDCLIGFCTTMMPNSSGISILSVNNQSSQTRIEGKSMYFRQRSEKFDRNGNLRPESSIRIGFGYLLWRFWDSWIRASIPSISPSPSRMVNRSNLKNSVINNRA